MIRKYSSRAAVYGFFLALFAASTAGAQDDGARQSDWIELVRGHKDAATGMEVMEIDDKESPDTRKLTLAVPKASVGDRDEIEEVVVVGRRPEQVEPEPIEFSYEWVEDYDNDRYGLVIRIGKESNWPIRLYMSSNTGFVDRTPGEN